MGAGPHHRLPGAARPLPDPHFLCLPQGVRKTRGWAGAHTELWEGTVENSLHRQRGLGGQRRSPQLALAGAVWEALGLAASKPGAVPDLLLWELGRVLGWPGWARDTARGSAVACRRSRQAKPCVKQERVWALGLGLGKGAGSQCEGQSGGRRAR